MPQPQVDYPEETGLGWLPLTGTFCQLALLPHPIQQREALTGFQTLGLPDRSGDLCQSMVFSYSRK